MGAHRTPTVQEREAELSRLRRGWQAKPDRELADALGRLAQRSNAYTGQRRVALLMTCATRLWRQAGPGEADA